MEEHPPPSKPTAVSGGWSTWLVVLVVAAAVFAGWSASRWKPWLLFPLAYGATVGFTDVMLGRWLGPPRVRRRAAITGTVAVVGFFAAMIWAAEQSPATAPLPEGLAGDLLRSMTPELAPPSSWPSRVKGYFHQRYGETFWRWQILGEVMAAAGAAAAVSRTSSSFRTEPVA